MSLAEYTEAKYPLHKAAREGRAGILKLLLSTGKYDINFGCFDLIRPLHEACLAGHTECVRTLLEHGAEVNARNIDGGTPLCDACCNGNLEIIRMLLEQGALVNPPHTLNSPLHEAALRNKWGCVQVLVEYGVKINASDCHHGTPLHVAAVRGYLEFAAVLLSFGANVNAPHIHSTPLHLAARQLDVPMIILLLEHGANVFCQDNHGKTPEECIAPVGLNVAIAKKLLHNWACNPKPLQHFCRLVIRDSLRGKGLRLVEKLHVPRCVKDFLQFLPLQKNFFL
ncbi:ankyrin repeat and SOCS box protein 13-like [Pomacea canaliculata]|uniref:ankyrin repeat and SOCS box protein 13-like n=1 Tax=Pomacea canaliculata TaxID=400727 RepID=UPI000D73461C|nr:ankyrin repeat and SOCS box protein 13-like [Pomacea canaliculata]